MKIINQVWLVNKPVQRRITATRVRDNDGNKVDKKQPPNECKLTTNGCV